MKRALQIAAALSFILGLGWAWLSRPSGSDAAAAQPAPRVGAPAPDFTLATADGGSVSLAELRGKVVVLNFWATWCPPCRVEMPALDQLQRDLGGQGVVVLAVNQLEDAPKVAGFMRDNGLAMSAALDLTGEVNRAYGVRGLPTTYFVDREGVIRDAVFGGPMVRPLVESKIAPLLPARP